VTWMTGPLPTGRVRLRFVSPTAFSKTSRERRNRATTLFPRADLAFESLLRIWNKNVTQRIDDGLRRALLEVVQEEAHELRTVPPVRFDRHRLKGFVGFCEYSCGQNPSDDARRLISLMADFAYFSGVGLKRTMGMGQVIGEIL